MANDLAQAIDLIYQGKHSEVEPELFKTIGTTLLLERQGKTASQIAKMVGLDVREVRELVIRVRGWEATMERGG